MKKFKHSEITPEKIYNKRRSFIRSMGYGLGTIALSSVPLINAKASNSNEPTSYNCLLYTSPSPRDTIRSRMPSSA